MWRKISRLSGEIRSPSADGARDDVLDEATEKPGEVKVFFLHLVPQAVGGAVDG